MLVSVFLLALTVSVVSRGVFNGFDAELVWSIDSLVSSLGLFFSLSIVTHHMARTSYHDELDNNDDLKAVISEVREKGGKLETVKARNIISEYNKEQKQEKKQDVLDEAKAKLENKADRYRVEADALKEYKWYRLLKTVLRIRHQRKFKKITRKAEKLRLENIYVNYEPITVEDVKTVYTARKNGDKSEKRRLNDDPVKVTNSTMAMGNFIKIFVLLGLQGMVFFGVTSWVEFFVTIVVIITTLLSTGFFAYEFSGRYTRNVHYENLVDKRNLIDYILEKQRWYDIKEEATD